MEGEEKTESKIDVKEEGSSTAEDLQRKSMSNSQQKQVSMMEVPTNDEKSDTSVKTSQKPSGSGSIKIVKSEGFAVDLRDRKASSNIRKQKVGSIIAVTKGSATDLGDKKTPKFMNTYKLESDNPFNVDKVSNILKTVMDELVDDELEYDVTETPLKAKQACGLIRTKIKDLRFDRYKLVCIVTLGEKKSQDVYSTARFLWDVERDKFATYSQENMRMFGIASVFGLYYE